MNMLGKAEKSAFPNNNNRENAMKSKKKKRKTGDIIRIIVLLIALSVLLYPTISNYLYEKNSSTIVADYDRNVQNISDEEKEEAIRLAREYNARLSENQGTLGDGFSEDGFVDEEYESLLNSYDIGMMGYIHIPKIDVELPIYHGTKESVLQVGVGHLRNTSLPVGGESTHSVLTGHRGLPSRMLFTDLDQLKTGDIFYVKILGETFAYEVDQIKTVLPEETEGLQIVEGQDYITLITCTPYGINTHRLLVRGHRIPYEEAIEKVPDEIDRGIKIPFEVRVLLIGLSILALVLIIFAVVSKVRKRKVSGEK